MRVSLAARRTVVAAFSLVLVAGAAFEAVRAASQQAKLTGDDATAGDSVGYSVAISGDTGVVGALGQSGLQGAAYVFTRSGTSWTQEAKLEAADAVNNDQFGWSVAVSGDTAVVGAYRKSSSQGAAYVFTRTGTTWSQEAKLTASDPANNDSLGHSVAIEGDTAVVGAQGKNDGQGAAYVFTRTGTTWTQQAKLTAADGAAGELFGSSVAVAGGTAIVGAQCENLCQGAAYVFTRAGTVWTFQQKLKADDAANDDTFGVSVALEGDTAVVGSYAGPSFRGAAYVFKRSVTQWTQEAKLTASDAANFDFLGQSVALAGDYVVVGAIGRNASQGAIYVFRRTGTDWAEETIFTPADVAAGARFGYSVSLADGTAVAGAYLADAGEGAAYVIPLVAPPPITSFFLPKKVTAKVNAKAAGKSSLAAGGIFDTGPDAPQFESPATLDVGGLHFDIPGLTASGKKFVFTGSGVTFSIAPNPYGSSRAKFKLKFKGDLTGKVVQNGPLDLYFENAITDGGGTVALAGGVFGLGKVRGALIQPNLFVVRAHANLKGAGKDVIAVIVGLATGGETPPAAAELTIGFGANVAATIPASSFVRKGTTDTFTGNQNGITKVVVDYAREQIAVTGKGLTLEPFAQGGNPVLLTVGLGGDVRAVLVRMGRIGNVMKY